MSGSKTRLGSSGSCTLLPLTNVKLTDERLIGFLGYMARLLSQPQSVGCQIVCTPWRGLSSLTLCSLENGRNCLASMLTTGAISSHITSRFGFKIGPHGTIGTDAHSVEGSQIGKSKRLCFQRFESLELSRKHSSCTLGLPR